MSVIVDFFNQQDIQAFISFIATVVTGSATWLFFIRRKYFKDSNEIGKDQAEIDLIHHLEKQLLRVEDEKEKLSKRCEYLDTERLKLAERVYKLTSEIDNLQNQLNTLKGLITNLSSTLEIYKHRLKELENCNRQLDIKIKELELDKPSQNDYAV